MSGKIGAEVWYLFHSGFAVKIGGRFLIFDYYNTTASGRLRGLEGGVVDPKELAGSRVTVFASHVHADHYVPSVLKWAREVPDIRYVLSFDIDASGAPGVVKAYPGQTYGVDGMTVRTLRSTDEGVAFIVEAEGIKIYHAGDLNWWHWEGEPDEENAAMGAAYKKEIDKLRGETFDLAFVPVDPRLGNEYLWGLDYFMKTVGATAVFPMHFGDDHSIFDRLDRDPAAKDYRNRLVRITRRGEKFAL
ncbi:L-ascorbate metabolism protein UlaG, beta-lactamase superfamily [Sporobacter termitidis DSM 10068]|uniref:L-ascorbate metabolism protein UlaG, beta-lactamase superfamily n=1 Tax=Sporobacter termitidis DSM 10068 TaxID=1123282 RepID=A0A1M5YGW4_9FIRM|nr:MBL fold metallo-hydrolase [Sporobacter termitidis]SHI11098.1 L-ascorbate metabolism protein UlaG, beta-lactamase superfamily [Sporobacter termitidis DSM 10068]